MKLNTKNFGELTIDEKDIITFDVPLSGLPNSKKYVLISDDEDLLFYWLQSVDEPNLCLCLLDVFRVMPDYNPEVPEFKVMALGTGEINIDDIKTYNIAVIPNDVKEMTVNLLAPIIINNKTNRGAQLITSNDNEISFKIFDKLGLNAEGGAN